MLSFYDYYDQLDNRPDPEPDDNDEEQNLGSAPPPPEYQLANAADDFSDPGNVLGGTEYQTCGLTPISWEDMARASTDDVEANMWRLKSLGYNPTKLGDRMSDEEFAQWTGMPWQANQS